MKSQSMVAKRMPGAIGAILCRMHLNYRGGARGLAMLTAELDRNDVPHQYDPPFEARGTSEAMIEVTIWIGQQGAAGLVGGATVAGALRAKDAVKAKLQRAEIEAVDVPGGDQ